MKLKYIFRLTLFTLSLVWSGHSYAIDSEYWGYCAGAKAFSNAAMTLPKPDADWVCQAPTADQTGEAIERNTLRCLLDQKESCQVAAGGDAAIRGDHNVPRDAWYWIPGATEVFPDVRCQCGCFTGDVEVLTNLGPMQLYQASQKASGIGGLSMAIFNSEYGGLKGSERLFNRDFVVGPEEKPLINIVTASGKSLTMTDSHPVLLFRDGNWKMMRAEYLTFGDTLMNLSGTLETIVEVTSYQLPESSRQVYNFDTKGKSDYEHIIVANSLRVGDLKWQKRLDERNNREENLLNLVQR